MTSQTFNLDLIPQGVPPIVHVSQYDKGQTWIIHLFENGVVFPVPSGTSAVVQGTKPDNTGFQYPAVISAGDNVVTFTVEQQMTVLAGELACELVLVNGEEQVATVNFILAVEPAALDDETIISETELPLIEQAAELGAVINAYATQIHADATTAANAATSATASQTAAAASEATATQAADDALASQTAAASSASNAATSETNAAGSATDAAGSASAAAQSASDAAASAALAAQQAATDMTGATASADGAHGLVPAPAAGDDTKFLGGDGTWKDVPVELSGLTDVTLSSPADGQLLRYDADEHKWKNYTPIEFVTAEVLYEGNFASGSITLKNAADVKALIVNTIYDIPCFGGFGGGLGGYYNGTPNYISYRFAVVVSGNDVILSTDANHLGVVDANVNQVISLTRIVGIRAKNFLAPSNNTNASKKGTQSLK